MEVDLELAMKLSRREPPIAFASRVSLGSQSNGSNKQHMCYGWVNIYSLLVTAQHCFHRLKNGNFEFDDLPHSGRPLQVDMDLLNELIEQDPRLTTRCLAERLGCSHIPIETHLHELGKTWKYGSLDTS